MYRWLFPSLAHITLIVGSFANRTLKWSGIDNASVDCGWLYSHSCLSEFDYLANTFGMRGYNQPAFQIVYKTKWEHFFVLSVNRTVQVIGSYCNRCVFYQNLFAILTIFETSNFPWIFWKYRNKMNSVSVLRKKDLILFLKRKWIV